MMIAMRALAAALALGLAFAALTPAEAQQPPAAAVAQGQAPATADPARLAAAHQLLTATNTDAQFTTIIPLMFRQMRQSIPAQGPKQTEVNQVFDEIQKQFIDRRGEILDQIAQLYAARFTAEEMNTLSDFYRSPIGQKFITAMPDLAADAMRLGTSWGQQIGQEAKQKIREELQKRGVKL